MKIGYRIGLCFHEKRGERIAIAPKALDGDVILCAQAHLLRDEKTKTIVAMTNVAHLSRFTAASDWKTIE